MAQMTMNRRDFLKIAEPNKDILNWISTNLSIITKAGERIRLVPNAVQRRLHMSMQQQRQRGLPVRLRLLKARQFGCSTWIEAEGFHEVYHRPNWRAMAVSVDADSTEHIFGMTKVFDEDLPEGLQKKKDNTNRREIVYSRPHRSRFMSQTAGKMSLGRSFTAQFCHASEIAFWENAGTQMNGLEEIVPLRPETTIIQETTANGQGGYFYEGFWDDVERLRKHPDDLNGYLPIFLPWYIFPEYAIEPPDFTIFTSEERALQKQFSLTDAQLYWRRLKIASKNGDLGLFAQEYPATAREAFQASGNPVYGPEIIATQAAYQGTQFERVLFDETHGTFGTVATEETTNCWLLARRVHDDHDYAIGIDTMEGRLSDLQNPKSKRDWDAVMVLDRNTGEYVALYHGRGDQKELAEQAFRAAVYYNEAWVAPEIPQSMVLLSYFKARGYQYLYNRQRHEDRETDGESEVLGWRTTAITRKWLVDDFLVALKEASVKLIFPAAIDEMRTFVRDKTGRPGHLPGEHDDILFAAMIAFQVHQRCPLGSVAYKDSHTGEEPESEDRPSLARIGATDPGIEDEDDDDYWDTHTY